MVTVNTLSGESGTLLYCPDCGAESSATPGDYFWMDPNRPFICVGLGDEAHEPTEEIEVRRRVLYDQVTP